VKMIVIPSLCVLGLFPARGGFEDLDVASYALPDGKPGPFDQC
jgi:hypothetical protein